MIKFLSVFLLIFPLSLSAQSKYWVFFKEKESGSFDSDLQSQFSERAIQKRIQSGRGFDWYDRPVSKSNLNLIQSAGLQIVMVSRWLNAVTVLAEPGQLAALGENPAVLKIDPVKKLKPGIRNPAISVEFQKKTSVSSDPFYGESISQLSLTHLTELHQLGITGRGIVTGMLDAGTKWRTQSALKSINVLAEYDFVEKDTDASGDDSHGTAVLSLMGAYEPGTAIGGAYGSGFLIAKTEYSPTETPVEEDNWVAGIEWMDQMGADVVNSSLGYSSFDDGSGYFYSNGDFDGQTAKCTQAADIAVSQKGIAVFISAGNEGSSKLGTLLAPSDGFYVFSSGAADVNGDLAGFSSTGPTNDGRIKPDGLSFGVLNWVAKPSSKTDPAGYFAYGSGTSYASPLSASAGALILSVYPELTPGELSNALRKTAENAANPDNRRGYGILNARAALFQIGPAVSNLFSVSSDGNQTEFKGQILWDTAIDPESTSLFVYKNSALLASSSGSSISGNSISFVIPQNFSSSDTLQFEIKGQTTTGRTFSWPRNPEFKRSWITQKEVTEASNLRRSGKNASSIGSDYSIPGTFTVSAPYPNPFNPETRAIVFSERAMEYTLTVYSILGQEIEKRAGMLMAGTNYLVWNPGNSHQPVSSGVYLITVSAGNEKKTVRAVYTR